MKQDRYHTKEIINLVSVCLRNGVGQGLEARRWKGSGMADERVAIQCSWCNLYFTAPIGSIVCPKCSLRYEAYDSRGKIMNRKHKFYWYVTFAIASVILGGLFARKAAQEAEAIEKVYAACMAEGGDHLKCEKISWEDE